MEIDGLIEDLLEGDLSDSTLISALRDIQERQSVNIIASWSWNHPTEEGDYLVCYGDVETSENVFFMRLHHDPTGTLVDRENDSRPVLGYPPTYKFAKLIYRPSEIKANGAQPTTTTNRPGDRHEQN